YHAHQHSAGGASVGDDAAASRVTLLHEKFARGDEISKGIDLLLALAFGVPPVALVLAAADVGDGKDETAVDEREPARGKRGGNGDAVGAIAVEKQRRRAVQPGALLIEEGYRHGFAVRRRRQQAARDIGGWIVAAPHPP